MTSAGRFAPLAFIAALLLTACSSSVPLHVVADGTDSRVDTQQAYVVKDDSSWNQARALIYEASPAPVDFNTSMAIVAFSGRKPTQGYDIRIEKAAEYKDRIVVTIIETYPHPQSVEHVQVMSPYAFATVPRSDKPVEFVWRVENAPR